MDKVDLKNKLKIMKFYKITLLLLIVGFLNLAMKINDYKYQIECISLETDGYISLKIWNPKSGNSYKSVQAQKDAIHSILYTGIAGTNGCTTQRALLNCSEEIEKFKKIKKEFFNAKGKWILFTRSSEIETTLPTNISDKKWKVYKVSVNKDAIRKYLEENQIIKSLNTGF